MPDALTHPTPQELSAFSLGKLPPDATAAVAGHLETCAACRRAVESLPPDTFLAKLHAAKPGVSSAPRGRTVVAPGVPGVAAAPPEGLPPELVSYAKYRFVRELGRGGMGVVYQAEQTIMGRPVAIKVIHPAVLAHPDALPRFQAEVQAAAKLDHPNIVRAYDAEQVGSLHLLVMEYVEGTNLADLVARKGPLPVAYACHFVRQAALGLQNAFEQGMAHRDIKPHNMMVTAKGQLKVLDFGLARLRGGQARGRGLTEAGSFMGTPEYVAPEQATDARSADTRADIYSLGCTLYFLLTGAPPFQEETAVKLILAHIEREAPPLHTLRPDVPPELSAVVGRMLAKDPAQRYQQPADVAQALVPFLKVSAKPGAVPPAASASAAAPARPTPMGTDTGKLAELPKTATGVAPAGAADPFAGPAGGSPPPLPGVGPAVAPAPLRWYRRPPVLAGAAAAVVTTLALGVWLLIGTDSKPVKAEKPAPTEATLALAINPPGAQVFANEQPLDVQVPADHQPAEIKMKPGKYRLEVRKEGFEPKLLPEIELLAGMSMSIQVQLDRVRQPVQVPEPQPREAKVAKRPEPPERKPVRIRPTAPPSPPPQPVSLIPESVADALQRAREDHEAALKRAGEQLLAAFDRDVEAVRSDGKMKEGERQSLLKVAADERERFQTKGTLPWSPRMRPAALEYLRAINAAAASLTQAYDQAAAQIREERAAAALTAERKKALQPKVVGVWECTTKSRRATVKTVYNMYADGKLGGTGNSNDSWKLTTVALEITLHRAGLVSGKSIDTCLIGYDGKSFTGKNFKNESFRGVLK